MGVQDGSQRIGIDGQRCPRAPFGDPRSLLFGRWDELWPELLGLHGTAQSCPDDMSGVDAAVDEGFFLPFQRVHPDIDLAGGRNASDPRLRRRGRCYDLGRCLRACLRRRHGRPAWRRRLIFIRHVCRHAHRHQDGLFPIRLFPSRVFLPLWPKGRGIGWVGPGDGWNLLSQRPVLTRPRCC